MTETGFHLNSDPIVEAVVDIDCALPPTTELATLEEPGREAFASQYPKFKKQFMQEHSIKATPDGSAEVSNRTALQSLRFISEDEKQLVQLRANGFSFNRLAPYGSLDDHLPEILNRWEQFCVMAEPVQIRRIALRYINRIQLPIEEGRVRLEKYLSVSPRLPENAGLSFTGFLHQHQAREDGTPNQVVIALASQPEEESILSVILDINAFRADRRDPEDLVGIEAVIQSLRNLKNRVFKNSLTSTCLSRY